jgi:hypothetical protein
MQLISEYWVRIWVEMIGMLYFNSEMLFTGRSQLILCPLMSLLLGTQNDQAQEYLNTGTYGTAATLIFKFIHKASKSMTHN